MQIHKLILLKVLMISILPESRSQQGNSQIPGCAKTFSIKSNTIIRSKDSQENGAVFIQEVEGISLSDCIRFCCSTPYCDVAVFGNLDTSCYLFACDITNSQKCEFSDHADFESAILSTSSMPAGGNDPSQVVVGNGNGQQDQILVGNGQQYQSPGFSNNQVNMRENQFNMRENNQFNIMDNQELSRQIKNNSVPSWSQQNTQTQTNRNVNVKKIEECGRWEFSCGSGECIAIYDTCNGIAQCADSSDEDTEYCSAYTSTTKRPSRLRTTQPAAQLSNNRSKEKSDRKPLTANPKSVTSHPKWLEKLSDSSGSGGKSGKPKDAESKSLESGEMVGYKVLDYRDTVIEEIGDKIIESHHSIFSTLAFVLAMLLLSFALVVGFKSIRRRTFLYRRVLLSSDDNDYDGLNL